MQVIIFSILLLGVSGVVLDAGRLYSTHSQMQAYADHMAVAAANELDGRADSLDRAADAVYNFSGSLPFIDGQPVSGDQYTVEEIIFYSQMGTPTGHPTDLSDSESFIVARADAGGVSGSSGAGDAAMAQYAAVVVSEKQIGSIVGSIGEIVFFSASNVNETTNNDGEGGAINTDGATRNGNISINTVAVATLSRKTCVDISTIVLCNPWEDIQLTDAEGNPTGSPLGSSALDRNDLNYQDVRGRSLMTFAANYDVGPLSGGGEVAITDGKQHGSLFSWDMTNQVMRLTDPVSDPAGVCDPGMLLDTEGNVVLSDSGLNYDTYRDLCLMARARAETVCFEDTIRFKPATGPMLVRATNPAFDRWPEPFQTMLQNDVEVPNSGLSRAQFFEPDILATSHYESADRHGPIVDPATDCPNHASVPPVYSEQDDDTDWNANSLCGMSDNFQYVYEGLPSPDLAYLPGVMTAGRGRDACHSRSYRDAALDAQAVADALANGEEPPLPDPSDDTGCVHDFIGDYHLDYSGGGSVVQEHRFWINNYWNTMYREDTAPPPPLPEDVMSWYQLYQHEKANMGSVTPWPRLSRISQYNTENAARLGMGASESERQQQFVKHRAVEYETAAGHSVLSEGYERRRIRSAMVNCRAASDLAGASATEFEAPVAAIVDFYLPDSAVNHCGVGTDAVCEIDDAIEARMFVELIDTVDDPYFQRYTAYLVR